MPLKAPKNESSFELVPAGNHVARVYRIIHIGTIPETYMGEEKMMNKVMIGFELLNKKKVFKEERGEEPYVISREYTLSMNEKSNLCKLIEGMLGMVFHGDEGEGFDVFSLIGQECLVNVVHKKSAKGNDYANITGASPIPEGMNVPKGYNPVQKLTFGEGEWKEEVFTSLPEFIQKKIASSKEFRKLRGVETGVDTGEIPF